MQIRKKKALIFFDFDMLIRHFILSGVFEELEREYDVTYVFHHDSTSSKQGIYTDVDKLGLAKYLKFQIPRERMGRWTPLTKSAQLHNLRGTHNYKPMLDLFELITPDVEAYKHYKRYSLPGIFHLYKMLYLLKMGVHKPLLTFIKEAEPDIVLHPTILAGYFINELNLICRKLRIPLVTLMNSWDNPSNKAAVTGFPDRLVVWGEQTRQHAIDYLGMPPERIEVFGAAQFQLYRTPVTETEEELRSMFKVPPGKPILLYGGTSKSVIESNHLIMIDEAIETGRIPPCHVIYRPHPWRGELLEGEKSFYELGCKNITIDPFMEVFYKAVTTGQHTGFAIADYEVTKKILHLVDGVISPVSTILLEGIIFGNPALVLFIDDENSFGGKALSISRRLTHFTDFVDHPGITSCFDASEIPDLCKRLLQQAQDEQLRAMLKNYASNFVVLDGPTYGERLLSLANELTSS